MGDIATYFTTFGAELAAALPRKVYDPVAWGALIGAALIGALLVGATRSRRGWIGAGAWFILTFSVLTLESVYLSSPVPRGDSAALSVICVIGVWAGHGLWSCIRRASAQQS